MDGERKIAAVPQGDGPIDSVEKVRAALHG